MGALTTADRIRVLAAQGKTQAQIARETGVCAKRVSELVARHGIEVAGVSCFGSNGIIPRWVPRALREDYHFLSRLYGEEHAASRVRQMKAEASG